MQKGNISVQSENIFPIIKQFLYSDQEIFLRELVSNAVDATTKVKALASKGEMVGELGNTRIRVIIDKEQGTLTISDRGIGMSGDEINRYLNQIAFSSASEFLEKFKNESIIGHFGLGFYSAFMVAKKVEVFSKSYRAEEPANVWSCEGSPEFTLAPAEKSDRGTDLVLHINDESKEYLEEFKIQELLDKYCKFLPVEIEFGTEKIKEGEGEDAAEIEIPKVINNPSPIWKKNPQELKDEDYINFYNELYPYSPAPLFWIHLNIDYPFNLTGVLYFPKIGNAFDVQKNKIQLYSNQVFVTDNVKEIIPEFLMLLHGIIDSPDIPLNVSRSYLQSDKEVKKITGYITKKVADKLGEIFAADRTGFEQKWEDFGIFVKYGMISEDKFYEKAKDYVLLSNTDGKFFTLEEYQEKIKDQQTDKNGRKVFIYTNQPEAQHSYIQSANSYGYHVLKMDQVIDNHFMQQMEYKLEKVGFVRVDSETADQLVPKDEKKESVLTAEQEETISNLFKSVVTKPGHDVQLKPLSPTDFPVFITKPEFMRRFKEMQSLQGAGADMFPDSVQVVVNSNHPIISGKLLANDSVAKDHAKYLYNLALLSQGMLKGEELTVFIQQSLEGINK
jgi:molecular chaperone HtpG